MNDPREEKLPAWARGLLKELRHRAQCDSETLLKEVSELRPTVAKLRARNEALSELLQMAAKGGHVTSQEIVSIIEEYAPWKDEVRSA
jgi:hypothetical protein